MHIHAIRTVAASLLLGSVLCSQAQLLIGQTTSMTGPASSSVKENIVGVDLVINHVNATGGIHGEKLVLLRKDDAFEVPRAAENARTLIEDDKVLAMFMTRGTPHALATLPILDKHGVPLVAPSSGAWVLHQPVKKNVFNVRSPYQREAQKAIEHLITIGLQRIAVVHAADAFGADALAGAKIGFDKAGKSATVLIAADRDKPDYAAIVPKLVDAQVQAVLWIGTAESVANVVRALREARSAAQVVTLSNTASGGFIKQLGAHSAGVVVTQVFPSERALAHPMVNEATKLARAAGVSLSPAALEGFASAKVLVEGLRRAGPKPTRAKLQAALESIRGYDLGGGLEISYSPQDHTGIDFTEMSIISDGRFKR